MNTVKYNLQFRKYHPLLHSFTTASAQSTDTEEFCPMKMQIKWTSINGIELKYSLFCNGFASTLDCKHIISAAADLYLGLCILYLLFSNFVFLYFVFFSIHLLQYFAMVFTGSLDCKHIISAPEQLFQLASHACTANCPLCKTSH